jgi:predicted DNA-binding protein (MmcQ/YjbR family)
MNIEEIRNQCLSYPAVEEYMPFDDVVICFKVGGIEKGKIFSLLSTDKNTMNLKCDPDRAILLREEYDQITPGFHMNKKHWNTIHFEDQLPNKIIIELIHHSYELVKSSLPLKIRNEINNL